MAYIQKSKLLLPGDLALPPVGDSKPRVYPIGEGCHIEQVAVYSDGSNQVRFVENIWNALSETHKAALLIHEAVYKSLRLFGDTNSDRTRLVVAYLFSHYSFLSSVKDAPLNYLNCWATSGRDEQPEFQFIVYPTDASVSVQKQATLQFVRWNGDVVFNLTQAKVPMDFFAQAFYVQAEDTGANYSLIQNMQNELLNVKNFSVSKETNQLTQKVTLKIQASNGQFDQSQALEIKCQNKLTHVTLFDSGWSEE